MAIDREKIHVAAQKYVEKKKYDKAVLEYQKVIQEDPNDARTLLKIGDLQTKMDEYAGAAATYERVGRFYASQGFSLKAIAVYKQVREIVSRHVPQLEEKYAHITPKLAELYQQLGLTSDALAALDEVATRLQRQGREPEAVEVFRKIVELDASNPLPHLRLAEALSRSKDVDGAVAEFSVAAGQLGKVGRRDDALKVLDRLLQHRPDPAHARVAAELYLGRNGSNDGLQALAKLQICFQANPRDLDTLSLLSRAFNHIGQAAKAIEVQKEMARIARDAGKVELFHEIVDRLLELVPNDETVQRLANGSEAPGPSSEAVRNGAATRGAERADAHGGGDDAPYDADEESSYEDVGDTEIHDADEPMPLPSPTDHPPHPGHARAGNEEDEYVDTSVEVVEVAGEPEPGPASEELRARLAQVLTDAASFRRARLPSKAAATLRAGLRAMPQSTELREVLCDVLVEWGRPEEAVHEMLELSGLQIDALDVEAAARTLQNVLALEPRNARASGMLRELGYELVEEPEAAAPAHDEPVSKTDRYDIAPEDDRTAGNAHLPAFDLDEPGRESAPPRRGQSDPQRVASLPQTARAANARRAPSDVARGDSGQPLEQMDDPFAEPALPSFPLEAPTDDGANRRGALASVAPPTERPPAPPPESAPAPSPPRSGAELESALEEAEFFASRGLFDDARAILAEQIARLPNHPLLVERLAELDEQEQSAQGGGSGTRPSPAAGGIVDRSFDIAESLDALDNADRASGVGSSPGLGMPTEQVDVEEVFAKFKEGVAKQIDVDDAQSHYDLGLAYKDMGLVDDAIREFETAARDPHHACVCYSMIGMIQLERGSVNDAIEAFTLGLDAPERTKEQEAALSYEIGAAYEAKKMAKQAIDHFQRAARAIPGFRDVVERVRRLQRIEPKQPSRAVAVGADDEFDRAFDDILGKRS
ncbi:MAG: tetratricopeptide repeat protein [Myxococcales bacterium]|nr:tetratricopeptide repeat protein [Myxococcales bacterium]